MINKINKFQKYVVFWLWFFRTFVSSFNLLLRVELFFSAYLQRGTDNIAILDWSDLAYDNYVNTFLRMKDIAKYTAKAIESMVEVGLNTDTIHLVGHSMGAQVAGFVGRYLRFTVPRVTGMLTNGSRSIFLIFCRWKYRSLRHAISHWWITYFGEKSII